MKLWLKRILLIVAIIFVGYLVSVTIVDACLMGLATPEFDSSVEKEAFLVTDSTRIDMQTGFKCSAFSSAYVLRHWGVEAHGDSVYEIMPDKMDDGYVYPKGIVSFIESQGFNVGYHIGNLTSLKNEVSSGHPTIVMIKIKEDEEWLHYVPVVGYTPDSIFIAESLPELCNANNPYYNRSIATEEFLKLWDTSAFKMPLYKNTFISIAKQ